MKAIQTANNKGVKLGSVLGFQNNNYIKLLSNINRTGLFSAFTFLLLALTCLFPISKGEQNTEAVTGTAQSSSLTLNVSSAAASVEFDVNSTDGTFASSSSDNSAAFSVVTNNFSGYTLSISGSDNDGKLYDTTKKYFLEPLISAVSEADFSSTSSLNGKWGYKPSKFNSVANNNYLPAPTTTASTLDTTSVANTTANNYTISLGLRADYGTAANTYTNAFVITAVPNPIAYVITYDANTTDTVSNMPASQNSTTSATEITLSDKTPAREGYDFKGWCTVKPTFSNGTDSCSGATYQPGFVYGIDQTTQNVITLYAMWQESGTVITYNANGGYFGNDTPKTTNIVVYDPNTPKVTKISKSHNVDDNGNSIGSYNNNLSVTDTVTIPGADELHITITYQTEDASYDWVAIYDGSVIPSASNFAESITGRLGGATKVEKQAFIIPGDTARFFFRTDDSKGNFYGYYATVEGEIIKILNGEVLTPARDGYVFDGWYTDPAGTSGNEFEFTAGTTSQTVYAKWKKYSTVVFISKTGGSVNHTSQSVLERDAISINGNTVRINDITVTANPNSNYAFGGWINECGSTMPASDCTITASWAPNSNTLQNASSCGSSPTTLTDARDGETYTVRSINGVCTMLQNLDFAVVSGMELAFDSTNVTATNVITTVGSLTSGGSYDEMRILKSSTPNYGTYYNYAAVTAGTVTGSSNTTNATQDICPKGWRLPTHNEQTSIAGGSGWLTSNVSAFSAVAVGYYLGGSLAAADSYGSWWSSTASSTVDRYYLNYSVSNGLYSGYDSNRGSVGFSVRCVLK